MGFKGGLHRFSLIFTKFTGMFLIKVIQSGLMCKAHQLTQSQGRQLFAKVVNGSRSVNALMLKKDDMVMKMLPCLLIVLG